jgi:hypothetical protein
MSNILNEHTLITSYFGMKQKSPLANYIDLATAACQWT